MKTVTASEFQKNFGAFKEVAQREPVVITSNGRESVVLISAAEYAQYRKNIKSDYVYGGKVTDDFERDLSTRMEKHKAVLEGLAK
ncbi:MAG: type II toxin-antitoxin system Phd/YefM family antitoxin [Nitrosomonas sp.]|nr:type II toxin-antitoxin system Phd/YefM family antitoxin [Nitrosomonas sp.]